MADKLPVPVPTPVLSADRRLRLEHQVRLLVAVAIGYNVVEAVVAITAGAFASSTALIGFGLDSVIEVASAVAVAWQFNRADPERWERATVRVIALAFFAMAAWVTADAIVTLAGRGEVDRSPVGIALTIASLITMPLLAWIQTRVGRELGSASVRADARQRLLCCYLSGSVLIGLLANAWFGWQWADSAAALVVAVLAVREGIEAWTSGIESPMEVLGQLGGDDPRPEDVPRADRR